jgi:Putative Flp pilus-assembly TadE/G-like
MRVPESVLPTMPKRPDGQVMVIFAMGLIMLLTFASLAFDIGRFYSERRFLQNAADAGALALANSLIRGESIANADAQARDIISRDLLGSPNGTSPALPPSIPVYETGHAGDPDYLRNGILVSTTSDIRVALVSDVGYTFGRVIGFNTNTIVARARVRTVGDLLPIAVRHYVNAPGPTVGATSPCEIDDHDFLDLIATSDTACVGTSTSGGRNTPEPGMDYNAANPNNDPSHHGPIMALVGQGASPGSPADFRGFIVLDIRNFSSASSNLFYNGVTAGTSANTLKDFESAWVVPGYAGPDFPTVVSPPDPNDQVGVMSGNSTGSIVDQIDVRYNPGDEVLAGVYSGMVMTIPDFAMSVGTTQTIGTNQNRNNTVTMSLTKNNAFAGTVTTTAIKDWGDAANPYGTTLTPITFSPTPATPATTVTWSTFSTTGAPVGVYSIWILGHSASPYLTDHWYPVGIKIGSVNRDFSSSSAGMVIAVPSTGSIGTGTMTFSTGNGGTTFGSNISLSVEGGPETNGVLPVGIGAVSISPSTLTLSSSGSKSATITINGGSLTPGEYLLSVRATGTNSAGQPVTRQVPFVFDIATGATADQYVDIMGFGVFRITCTPSAAGCPANSIEGYAITDALPDLNDPRLRRGQTARLVPWD